MTDPEQLLRDLVDATEPSDELINIPLGELAAVLRRLADEMGHIPTMDRT